MLQGSVGKFLETRLGEVRDHHSDHDWDHDLSFSLLNSAVVCFIALKGTNTKCFQG